MSKNIPGLKRGFSYRHATGGRGGLGVYTDGLLVAEYENYLGNDELVTIGGKNLTGVDQWFTEESETKNYALGTKMVVEDMVFCYAQVYSDTDSCWRGRGAQWFGRSGSGDTYIPTTAMTAASASATNVTLTTSQSLTEGEFENGRMALFPSVWTGIIPARVRTNDATSGGSTKFYLKEGLSAACGTTSKAFTYVNTYKNVGKAKGTHAARFWLKIVGCFNVNATASYYVWLQTWGPWMGQYGNGTYKPGLSKYQHDMYFDTYGAIIPIEVGGSMHPGTGGQRAGYVIGQSYDGTDGGDAWSPMIMLQISP